MDAQQLHRAWHERWDVMEAETAVRAHRCVRGDDGERLQLYPYLKQNPAVVLMTLGSSPDDGDGRKELVAGLQAGLPVLIWSHEGALAEEHVAVEAALGKSWGSFHETMARLRFAPDPKGDTVVSPVRSRFAVMWDDPSRLPELPDPITT